MTFPQDTTMLVLVAHAAGDSFTVDTRGNLALTVRSENRTLPYDEDALDWLENRGWLTVTADGTRLTERGAYWLERWLVSRLGKGRLRAAG